VDGLKKRESGEVIGGNKASLSCKSSKSSKDTAAVPSNTALEHEEGRGVEE